MRSCRRCLRPLDAGFQPARGSRRTSSSNRRRLPSVLARFETLLAKLSLEIVPVSVEQAHTARVAYRRFGRGNHPARLNYGDCFAYALAKVTGEPLLFKGDDFSQTDITPALRA